MIDPLIHPCSGQSQCKIVRDNSLRKTTVEGNGNECRVYAACAAHTGNGARTEEIIQWQMRECSCTDKYESMHAYACEREVEADLA